MREIVVISGKGGTGKTSLTAAFADLAQSAVICDLDVDAADLHLLLYPVVPDWVFELSLGYLMQLVVCITAFCWLFRKMMEQAGFPPSKHRLKYCGWLVLYIAVLYATGAFFTRIAGAFVLLRLPILPYALFSLLLGAGLYGIKFWKYGKDERLRERI